METGAGLQQAQGIHVKDPVEISFDCLPLRSVPRLDVPVDAPPAFRALAERVRNAIHRHGAHNTYYLYNAHCNYHLTNDPALGMLTFRFEGTVFTDESDLKTIGAELEVSLAAETCDWLTEPIVAWFRETVSRAVMVEFDRYIAAGDLKRTLERLAQQQAETDSRLGYLGMGL
jgi:hypothetical protein